MTFPAPTPTSRSATRVALGAFVLLFFAACTPSQAPATTIPTASATASPTQAATSAAASVTPTAAPSTAAACPIGELVARVTQWEGAAGHRIGTIELKNGSNAECTVPAMDKPQLVDGVDTVLIDGAEPTGSAQVAVAAGATLQTLVQTGNYCGPQSPIVPVTVAFVFPGGAGRIVAVPLTPEDTGGVPPCNGPGGPGEIEMHAWAP